MGLSLSDLPRPRVLGENCVDRSSAPRTCLNVFEVGAPAGMRSKIHSNLAREFNEGDAREVAPKDAGLRIGFWQFRAWHITTGVVYSSGKVTRCLQTLRQLRGHPKRGQQLS